MFKPTIESRCTYFVEEKDFKKHTQKAMFCTPIKEWQNGITQLNPFLSIIKTIHRTIIDKIANCQ